MVRYGGLVLSSSSRRRALHITAATKSLTRFNKLVMFIGFAPLVVFATCRLIPLRSMRRHVFVAAHVMRHWRATNYNDKAANGV
jgi:hypothetical protein